MGCEGIEIQIEAVTGEERQIARSQELPQGVDDCMCCVLCAGTQMEDWNNLRGGIDGQPEPEDLLVAAQPGTQFIQLEVREPEMAEGALVQGLCVLASASEPGGDGGLSISEDSLGSGKVQPFSERRQHHPDLVRGGFQMVQGSVASGGEGGAAGLTAKGLDPLGLAMLAIPNQRVDPIIGDAEGRALLVRTGEALGLDPLGCSSAAFHLTPGTYWQRRWSSTRRGSRAETTGGAIVWAAGLEQTVEPAAHLGCCSRRGRTLMGPT